MTICKGEIDYVVPTYPNRGLKLSRGEGVYLFDNLGNKYLDVMSNYGVNIFGYCHPAILGAITEQLKKLTNLHGSFLNDKRILASQKLVERCGIKDGKVYWANSGTEAVEAALKFAAYVTGKKKFVATKNSYHGKTLGALSASGNFKYREPFEPLIWNFSHVDFGDAEALEDVIDEDTAAIILEPIQGEGGVIFPPRGYLKKVREICDRKKILLILDEIQTGTGRTGFFLASECDRIASDILCLGKGLAGGLPVGAVVIRGDLASALEKGVMTSTFGGNPLVCAGVLSVLNLLTEELLGRVGFLGEIFLEKLRNIKNKKIIEVRGKGLLIGVELSTNVTVVLKRMQDRGVLAAPAGVGRVVRFLPPYVITEQEIDRATAAFEKALDD